MSIAYEINRLQTSKADTKEQVNIDKDYINAGIDFIGSETVNNYDEKIQEMQEAYKAFIPVNTTSDTQIDAPKGGIIIGKTLKGNTSQSGTPTPNAPVEVENVTGEQVVRVCGKNLLDNSILELFDNNKYIKTPGYNTKGSIIVSPNTTYTLSTQNISFTDINVYEFDENNNRTTLVKHAITPQHSFWFTTSATAKTISFYSNNNGLEMPSDLDFQIVVGNQEPTSFEEYQGKDYEINLGKNLADISQIQIGKSWSNENYAQRATILYIPIEKGKSYYLISTHTNSAITSVRAVVNHGINDKTNCYVVASFPYTNNNWEYVSIEVLANTTFTSEMLNGLTIQLEQSTTETDYAPYFTPIELNKIGNYQDFIRKGTGKNLFDKDSVIAGYRFESDGELYANEGCYATEFISVEPNTTYATSWTIVWNMVICLYDKDKHFTRRLLDGTNFTTTSEERYIRADVTGGYLETAQIEQGSSKTYYEPFGYKDKWYIEKNVEKYVFKGTESWYSNAYGTNTWILDNKIATNYDTTKTQIMSNIFKGVSQDNRATSGDNVIYTYSNNGFMIRNTTLISLTEVRNTTNGNYIYYILANPTYTLIENEELIEQLEKMMPLLEGQNNISVDGSIPVYMDLDYIVRADRYLIGNRREGK